MYHLESDAEKNWMARIWLALDFWVGWIATHLDLDQCEFLKNSIFCNWREVLLTDAGCKPQVGQNYMSLKKAYSHSYFFIMNEFEEGKQYVCKGFHNFLFYPRAENRKMTDVLKMDATKLSHFMIFVARGYWEARWCRILGAPGFKVSRLSYS